MRNIRWGFLALLGAVVSTAAWGQETGGRTDGPEGSEVGHGGYVELRPRERFALSVDWGGTVVGNENVTTSASTVGATASFLPDDWLALDLSGEYLFDRDGVEILGGPRFILPGYPVGFSAGLKAGTLIWTPPLQNTQGYFTLSPQAGLDLNVFDHVPMSLSYALDIPFGADEVINRFFVSVGYKF